MTTHTYSDGRDINDVEDMRSAEIEALRRRISEQQGMLHTALLEIIVLKVANKDLEREKAVLEAARESYIDALVDVR